MLRILKIVSYLITILFLSNILIALIFFPFEKKLRENFGSISFNDKIIKVIDIENNKELKKFIFHNYTGSYYDYDEFVGWKERKVKSKYFNVDQNGRFVLERPSKCKRNVYIYGSSVTFGYLSKDQNTIASFLQKILTRNNYKNLCVYNHGRANFNSYRENLLLKKHIINENLNQGDFAIFLDGTTELLPSSLITKFKNDLKYQSNNFYNNFFYSFLQFLKSTPLIRFYEIIESKLINKESSLKVIHKNKIDNLIQDKKKLFSKNLKMRKNLCLNYNLNCFTFIEPNGYEREELKNTIIINNQTVYYGKHIKKFYNEIKFIEGTLNISDIFNESTDLIYVDGLHLSPYASNIIAENIFLSIKKKIN